MLPDEGPARSLHAKSLTARVAGARSSSSEECPVEGRIGLLITCAVGVHSDIAAIDRSPGERIAALRRGLAGWRFFERLGPVVVCEGSGFPEVRFRAEVAAPAASFEYLSTATMEASAQLGKGAAELDLVAHALEHSSVLPAVERVLKVTGRYAVLNGESLVDRLLAQESLPGVQVNFHNRLSYADSRVFLFSREFFGRWLLPLKAAIRDRPEWPGDQPVWLEHVLARAALAYIADAGTWDLLPLPLRVCGTSGTTGSPYDDRLATYVRAVAAHWVKSRALGRRPPVAPPGPGAAVTGGRREQPR
jgi:hypothetical protein